jgi:hypothetical protein
MPMANRTRVAARVDQMDPAEQRWTATASADRLRWRARQDADRMMTTDSGDLLPLNPWWYH